MTTKIEWVKNADGSNGKVWNILTGCKHKSAGCDHCWAERMATRQVGMGNKNYIGSVKDGHWTGKIKLIPDALDKPRHWKKSTRIFVQSMGDLFHQGVPFEFIERVFDVMSQCQQHTFMILTKRPERAYEFAQYLDSDEPGYVKIIHTPDERFWDAYGSDWPWPLPNVHLYTSIEDQATADERIPWLLKTPAAVRGVSLEPMLGPVDLTPWLEQTCYRKECPGRIEHRLSEDGSCWEDSICQLCGAKWFNDPPKRLDELPGPYIDHVIVGGESGPGARPLHPDWVRSVRDQCVEAGVPFFFKQWGEWLPGLQFEDTEIIDDPEITRFDTLAWNGEEWEYGGSGWDDIGDAVGAFGDVSYRVGKRAAGRMFDGRTWDEMPGQAKEE